MTEAESPATDSGGTKVEGATAPTGPGADASEERRRSDVDAVGTGSPAEVGATDESEEG